MYIQSVSAQARPGTMKGSGGEALALTKGMFHFQCYCRCGRTFTLNTKTWKESMKSMKSRIKQHSAAKDCAMSVQDIMDADVEAYTQN